jgi:hypothetical protein
VRSTTPEQEDLATSKDLATSTAVPASTVPINMFPKSSAAVLYSDSRQLRLYISDATKVVEQAFDGHGWTTGAFTAPGPLDTTQSVLGVVATAWSTHIRVYVTVDRGMFVNGSDVFEYCFDGSGWSKSDLKWPGQATSATSWNDGQDHIRVYVIDIDGPLVEYCWDEGSGWTSGTTWGF